MSDTRVKRHIVMMGIKCCFGIDGHGCHDCPYSNAECLEEKNCDQDLAKDVLDLIGRRDEEKEKAS